MVRPENMRVGALGGLRGRAAALAEHPCFIGFITALIVVNAITLGLETDAGVRARFGEFLHALDVVVLGAFVFEMLLKLFAYRLAFFRSGWNIFDLGVVGLALVPASGPFAVLRALRILRVLRLLSIVPQMRRILTALFLALPGMGAIIGVLMLIYYVAAVLATQIFGQNPDPAMQDLFGSIGDSLFTLFQIMTLEGWAEGIAQPTMAHYPWAWMYFVFFIVATSFAVLNLFIGIIVDAMNAVQEEEHREEKEAFEKALHDDSTTVHNDIKALRDDIAELKAMLAQRG